jgi:beta-glucosidase
MRDFITSLMQDMTPDEKIGQLNLIIPTDFTNTGAVINANAENKIRDGLAGGIFGIYTPEKILPYQKIAAEESRLKIPLLCGLDVIHGHKTIFPLPLALSCSWDMALIEKTAQIASVESTADGLNWVFSPMVDIARDPRWGRIAESAGEDPYLGAEIAKAMVRGYQGGDLAGDKTVMACVKHLANYGAAEGGREYNTTDMSRVRMYESYFPPYQAAIEAGCGSAMSSFNDIDSVPASANKWLMSDVLRSQWGFDGFVVSDYTAINEMILHGIGDLKTCAARALSAGTDMDMVGEAFLTTLKASLEDGSVTMDDIDTACRRILEAKYKLGLFDDPYRYLDTARPAAEILTAEHRAAARDAVTKSCVLLKNDGQLLPLKKSGSIALIGPLADDRRNQPGTWSVAANWEDCISLKTGIENVAGGDVTVRHAKGANITDDPVLAERLNVFGMTVEIDPRPPEEMIAEAVEIAAKSDVIVAVLGEAKEMSGEASSRTDISLPPEQQRLLDALCKTGKPVILVLMGGRPLTIGKEHAAVDALLMAWYGGTEAGNGLADLLFGNAVPSGKLTASFPHHVGQIPVYYAHKNTGRPVTGDVMEKFRSRYLDAPNDPLFPFGFGLSYTEFSYGDLTLDKTELSGTDDVLTARIAVTNTGAYDGAEIVQLYITDPVADIARAVMDLKAFQKIFIPQGETREAVFTVTTEQLKFYNSNLEHVWEPGEFIIRIGANAHDLTSASVNWQ